MFKRIQDNDWIYSGVQIFIEKYLHNHLRLMRLKAQPTYSMQNKKLKIDSEVVDLLASLGVAGKLHRIDQDLCLPRASDFVNLIRSDLLSEGELNDTKELLAKALDHEEMQLELTFKNLAEFYETGLSRVMFIVKRALKVELGLPPNKSDDKLLQPSDYLGWYADHFSENHNLFGIIGSQEMRTFYKFTRNVSSHHRGMIWDSDNNLIILEDKNETLAVTLYEFQKRYRYLSYVIDYGMRCVFAAFSLREKGPISNKVFQNYCKVFPENFPTVSMEKVTFYPE